MKFLLQSLVSRNLLVLLRHFFPIFPIFITFLYCLLPVFPSTYSFLPWLYILIVCIRVFYTSDCKSAQVVRTFLSILAHLNNAVVWMVSACPLISKPSSLWTNPLVTILSSPITIGITVTLMFHRFFVLQQDLATYLSFHFFFSFTQGSAIRQFLLFYFLLLYCLFTCTVAFFFSSQHYLVFSLYLTIFKCRSRWISPPGFDFPSIFFQGNRIFSQTYFSLE